jgi:hypothetical protein
VCATYERDGRMDSGAGVITSINTPSRALVCNSLPSLASYQNPRAVQRPPPLYLADPLASRTRHTVGPSTPAQTSHPHEHQHRPPHKQRSVPSSTTQSSSSTCPMPSLRNTPTAMTCPPPHHLAPPPSPHAVKAHKTGKSPTRRPRLLQRRDTAPRAAPQHSTPEARRLVPGPCVTAREAALHRGKRRLGG